MFLLLLFLIASLLSVGGHASVDPMGANAFQDDRENPIYANLEQTDGANAFQDDRENPIYANLEQMGGANGRGIAFCNDSDLLCVTNGPSVQGGGQVSSQSMNSSLVHARRAFAYYVSYDEACKGVDKVPVAPNGDGEVAPPFPVDRGVASNYEAPVTQKGYGEVVPSVTPAHDEMPEMSASAIVQEERTEFCLPYPASLPHLLGVQFPVFKVTNASQGKLRVTVVDAVSLQDKLGFYEEARDLLPYQAYASGFLMSVPDTHCYKKVEFILDHKKKGGIAKAVSTCMKDVSCKAFVRSCAPLENFASEGAVRLFFLRKMFPDLDHYKFLGNIKDSIVTFIVKHAQPEMRKHTKSEPNLFPPQDVYHQYVIVQKSSISFAFKKLAGATPTYVGNIPDDAMVLCVREEDSLPKRVRLIRYYVLQDDVVKIRDLLSFIKNAKTDSSKDSIAKYFCEAALFLRFGDHFMDKYNLSQWEEQKDLAWQPFCFINPYIFVQNRS